MKVVLFSVAVVALSCNLIFDAEAYPLIPVEIARPSDVTPITQSEIISQIEAPPTKNGTPLITEAVVVAVPTTEESKIEPAIPQVAEAAETSVPIVAEPIKAEVEQVAEAISEPEVTEQISPEIAQIAVNPPLAETQVISAVEEPIKTEVGQVTEEVSVVIPEPAITEKINPEITQIEAIPTETIDPNIAEVQSVIPKPPVEEPANSEVAEAVQAVEAQQLVTAELIKPEIVAAPVQDKSVVQQPAVQESIKPEIVQAIAATGPIKPAKAPKKIKPKAIKTDNAAAIESIKPEIASTQNVPAKTPKKIKPKAVKPETIVPLVAEVQSVIQKPPVESQTKPEVVEIVKITEKVQFVAQEPAVIEKIKDVEPIKHDSLGNLNNNQGKATEVVTTQNLPHKAPKQIKPKAIKTEIVAVGDANNQTPQGKGKGNKRKKIKIRKSTTPKVPNEKKVIKKKVTKTLAVTTPAINANVNANANPKADGDDDDDDDEDGDDANE